MEWTERDFADSESAAGCLREDIPRPYYFRIRRQFQSEPVSVQVGIGIEAGAEAEAEAEASKDLTSSYLLALVTLPTPAAQRVRWSTARARMNG